MREDASEALPAVAHSKKIGVLLVDDHAVVRQGLRMFIEMQKDMEVIGEGSNGLEAVELSAQLKPDVILLDLLMPEMDGVNATRKIMEQIPVLVCSSSPASVKMIRSSRQFALVRKATCSKTSSLESWCTPSAKPTKGRHNSTPTLPGA